MAEAQNYLPRARRCAARRRRAGSICCASSTRAIRRARTVFPLRLLAFDIGTILSSSGTSFLPRTTYFEVIDVAIGIVILAISRRAADQPQPRPGFFASRDARRHRGDRLVPRAGQRRRRRLLPILRTLRFLYTYQLIARLREKSPSCAQRRPAAGDPEPLRLPLRHDRHRL